MKKAFALMLAAVVLVPAGCSTTQHGSKLESKVALHASDDIRTPPAGEALLNRLVGKWVLNGTIAGKETTHDVDAEWVLNHEYVRLHEVSRDRNADGGSAYEAIVLISWDNRSGEFSCLWLDSTGGTGLSSEIIGRGKYSGDTIPFEFKFPSGDIFHAKFIFSRSAGTWQWVMDGESGGNIQPFARVILTKK